MGVFWWPVHAGLGQGTSRRMPQRIHFFLIDCLSLLCLVTLLFVAFHKHSRGNSHILIDGKMAKDTVDESVKLAFVRWSPS